MIKRYQYTIFSYYLTRTLFFGGMFHLLIETCKNDTLFISFMGMLLGYFFLYLLYKNKFIHSFMIGMISVIILFLCICSTILLTNHFLLEHTPILIVITTILLVGYYGSRKGYLTLFRSSELFIVISIFITIICYLGLLQSIQVSNIFPLFLSSISSIFKGIIIFSSTTLLPNILLIPFHDDYKFRDIGKGYILGCLSLICILFFILSIYGYSYSSYLNIPEYMVLKRIHFMNYIRNVENILVMEWIVNITLCILLCMFHIYQLLNTKKSIIVFIFIAFFCFYIYHYHYSYLLLIQTNIWILFILLLIISLITKKEKT